VPSKGKLIVMSVPTINASIELKEYKYIKKDLFKLIPDNDKTLGEELVFERGENGIFCLG